MTSYINQTIAREHVADLIAEAERVRVRRAFRQARREARAARRDNDGVVGPGARVVRRPHEVELAC